MTAVSRCSHPTRARNLLGTCFWFHPALLLLLSFFFFQKTRAFGPLRPRGEAKTGGREGFEGSRAQSAAEGLKYKWADTDQVLA